jgi:hypothetical protein
MSDLSTASFEELWEELCGRVASCMLIYRKLPKSVDDDADILGSWWANCPITERSGMIRYAKLRVERDINLVLDGTYGGDDPNT